MYVLISAIESFPGSLLITDIADLAYLIYVTTVTIPELF